MRSPVFASGARTEQGKAYCAELERRDAGARFRRLFYNSFFDRNERIGESWAVIEAYVQARYQRFADKTTRRIWRPLMDYRRTHREFAPAIDAAYSLGGAEGVLDVLWAADEEIHGR